MATDRKPLSEKITILICAKNEYDNLKKLIPLLAQQIDVEQILVVDDFSDDNSLSLLSACANEYSKLDYIQSSKNTKGKKLALQEGLSKVKTEWVLLTDADCKPTSENWAQQMLTAARGKEIVLGFSPYKKTKGFLNRWIRYEAVLTAIQYFSFSLIGKTYMGVGRNLLYAKSLVKSGQSLDKNIDLKSGDDDLMVNILANKKNVAIQLHPDTWMVSVPKDTWKSYFNQKRRHLSTASRYKTEHQIQLLLFSVSWILLYVVLLYLLIFGYYKFALLLFTLRILLTYLSTIKLFPQLGLADCIGHWWYLDLCTAVYFLFFSIFAVLPQKEDW